MPLFGSLRDYSLEDTGHDQIKESETMTPNLTRQGQGLPHDMTGLDPFRMPSLPQPAIDPLTQSPALPSDMQHHSDMLPLNAMNVDDE